MSALPVLYSFRRCPYAMRARLALRILDNHDHDNLLFQALIDRQVRDPNASQEVINQAMAKLLARFPAKR